MTRWDSCARSACSEVRGRIHESGLSPRIDVAPSGKVLLRDFRGRIRAALGFDDCSDLSAFPIEESDGGLRKVGNNGRGGRI